VAQQSRKQQPLVGYVLEKDGATRFVSTEAQRVQATYDGWTVVEQPASSNVQPPQQASQQS